MIEFSQLPVVDLTVPGRPIRKVQNLGNSYRLSNTREDPLYREIIQKLAKPKRYINKSRARKIDAIAKSNSQSGIFELGGVSDIEISSTKKRTIGDISMPDSLPDSKNPVDNDIQDPLAKSIQQDVVEPLDKSSENIAPLQNLTSSTTAKSKAKIQKELAPDQSTNSNALSPSIIFATIANTNNKMACMSINNSITQAAAGFKDGCVRLWSLDKSNDSAIVKGLWIRSQGVRDILPKPQKRGHVVTSGVYQQPSISSRLQKDYDSNYDRSSSTSSSSSSSSNRGSSSSSWNYPYQPMLELIGHSKPVYGVSCSDNDSEGRWWLSASADRTVRLWDVQMAQCVGLYHTSGPAWDVHFGHLGFYFAVACSNNIAAIYGTSHLQPLRILSGHSSDVNCVLWHGNCTLVATASEDQTVRLWDMRTGNTVRELKGCRSSVVSIAISQDGSQLAGGCADGVIYLWDLHTTRLLSLLQAHQGSVLSLAFSQDDTVLSSGGQDCSLRVWSLTEETSGSCSSSSSGSTGTTGSRIHPGNEPAVSKDVMLSLSVISPYLSYYTKYSPVYAVGYTAQDCMFAGGPFSYRLASETIESSVATEEETIASVGLSKIIPA